MERLAKTAAERFATGSWLLNSDPVLFIFLLRRYFKSIRLMASNDYSAWLRYLLRRSLTGSR
jgi:hypothetical protein